MEGSGGLGFLFLDCMYSCDFVCEETVCGAELGRRPVYSRCWGGCTEEVSYGCGH